MWVRASEQMSADNMWQSAYENLKGIRARVERGEHRDIVGRREQWNEIGRLQLDFQVAQGLTPEQTLLDLGCGCLRAGIHFVAFLEANKYYGVDISPDLLRAGYDVELAAVGLQPKLPRSHLAVSADFNLSEFPGISFDRVLAHSLFTHQPITHLRLCLARLTTRVPTGGLFFATCFLCPDGHAIDQPIHHNDGADEGEVDTVSYSWRNPFHYYEADITHASRNLPWRSDLIPDWGHRSQCMIRFERL